MNKRINSEDLKAIRKKSYNKYKEKFKNADKKRMTYLFVSFVLIICVFQALRGVYLNTAKYIALNHQLARLNELNAMATDKNKELKKQIQNCASIIGIEALARDNLKMVGKDEVLVVIKEPSSGSRKN